jgi:hypothetical protein
VACVSTRRNEIDAGITGVGEGGSPDVVASLAPIVIGRNALDTE